jgi:anhydro-N-acetylmuramic acid kinase
MSGTSLDGIDGVIAEISQVDPFDPTTANTGSIRVKTIAFSSAAFSDHLAEELLALQDQSTNELHRAYLAANLLADAYSGVVEELLRKANLSAGDITVIGAHGQTVRHRPELGFSIQLVNGARLAEKCHIDVACDFRAADIAAGGQGAPLVPAFHREVFYQHDTGAANSQRTRSIVNIGGIANFTRLEPFMTDANEIVGFDTGPGNTLMDFWCKQHLGHAFDEDGGWARSGTVQPALLDRFLSEPYFCASAPKSTGRDLFNSKWLLDRLDGEPLLPQDVQATLLELTALTIHREVKNSDVFVCGGGAQNTQLMARLQHLQQTLGDCLVVSTKELGIEPQAVEALAFAWLAYKRIKKASANLPNVTSARGPRILGALHCKP